MKDEVVSTDTDEMDRKEQNKVKNFRVSVMKTFCESKQEKKQKTKEKSLKLGKEDKKSFVGR